MAGLKKSTLPPKDQCQEVLRKLDIPSAKYQLGKTRVFLSLGVLDELKTKRVERMAKVCVKLQAAARAMSARARAIRAGARGGDEARGGRDGATEDGRRGGIAALKDALGRAQAAGVPKSPSGKVAFGEAQARLAEARARVGGAQGGGDGARGRR